MKTCVKCKKDKELAEFYNDARHKKDGKMSRCKPCHIEFIYKWRAENKDKQLAMYKRFRKKHPGIVRANRAKAHAAKLQAIPPWLSKVQLKEIEQFYSNCPVGYEVDHIIPLRGKEVKGLHVRWNLQYLNKSDNRKKSNKFNLER